MKTKTNIIPILTTLLIICLLSACKKEKPRVESLFIKVAPTKINYFDGERLNLSGLIVTLIMDNGEKEDLEYSEFINNELTCFPANGTVLSAVSSAITITHNPSMKSTKQDITFNILFDIEGNSYPVVKIGVQTWMAKNLSTTKYNDNTSIPLVTDYTVWRNITSPSPMFCWYDNDATYKDTYGALYNWPVITTNKLCPIGWHVPRDSEWTELISYLGDGAGGKLKEIGTTHWNSPNTGATNETKFNALPNGYRGGPGGFHAMGNAFNTWQISERPSDYYTYYIGIGYDSDIVGEYYIYKSSGLSVRCVKDR